MIVSASIRAAPHGNDPSRFGHLVVDLSQGGGHFVGKCAGHNHAIRLSRGGTEEKSKAIEIVARSTGVHHLHGAAGETEGHWPERVIARPIH